MEDSNMNSKELREKRARLNQQARAIIDKAEEEKRDLTSDERDQWDKIDTDIVSLTADIERVERQEDRDLELAASQGTRSGLQDGDANGENPEERKEQEAEAFRSWLIGGVGVLNDEQRAIMQRKQAEARAQGVGQDAAGGYAVDPGFVPQIETALKQFAGVRNTRATIIRTDSGNDIHWPTSDDTSNEGELLGENTQASTQDVTFGSKTLRAYVFTSKIVKASLQFLQDVSVSDIEGWLAARLGERVGRSQAGYHIEGTGSNQPEGLEQATTSGVTATATDDIAYDELVDLFHSVDPAYRTNAEWLMGDDTLKLLKKKKDGEGRPLWVPGVATREPDTILGKRYTVDQEIPDVDTGEIVLYFGDFSKFLLRDVRQMQMLRLTERFADYLQVGFLLFVRHDSALIDAGTHPIKYLEMA